MTRITTALVAGIVLVASSCGGSTDSGGLTDGTLDVTSTTEPPPVTEPPVATEPPVTEPPATEPPVATEPPATEPPATEPPATEPPATEPPAPATTAPPDLRKGALVLRPDGIGPFGFGSIGADAFADAVSPALGAPIQFSAETYPIDGDFYFENADTEAAFDHPFGETVCFSNALCAYFGGSSPDATTFVGWDQDESDSALVTPSGVTSGSVWADFTGVLDFGPGGCFSTGYGTADGVDVIALSLGEPFEFFDTTTEEFVQQVPDPADVLVISLSAGEQPFFLFDDC